MWTANNQPLQVFFGFQSKKTPAQDAKLWNSIRPFRAHDRGLANRPPPPLTTTFHALYIQLTAYYALFSSFRAFYPFL